jgi:hypothetical protein
MICNHWVYVYGGGGGRCGIAYFLCAMSGWLLRVTMGFWGTISLRKAFRCTGVRRSSSAEAKACCFMHPDHHLGPGGGGFGVLRDTIGMTEK